MNRRGFTMIELLLALALLASIIGACAVWINVAASASVAAGVGAAHQRAAAIQSAFTRIHDDLMTGDFDIRQHESRPRVRVEDGALVIELRQGSSCVYRLEHSKAQLVRQERDRLRANTRTVLNHVQGFECSINDKMRQLLVTIEPVSNSPSETRIPPTAIERRYQLR